MRKSVDIFIPCDEIAVAEATAEQFAKSTMLRSLYLLMGTAQHSCKWNTLVLEDRLTSSVTLRKMAELATADYILLITKSTPLLLGEGALERIVRVASDSTAAFVYADHYERKTVEG